MICPQFRPIVGGYERAAERLSRALAARGLRVTVAAERRDAAWPAREEADGVEIRRLWCVPRPRLHLLTSLLSLAWFLLERGGKFSVWHVHQYGPHAALAVALSRVLRRPVVLKLTDTGEMGIGSVLARGAMGRVMSALHRSVDACVALTPEMCAEALAFGISEPRIALIPNGIARDAFRPTTESARAVAKRALNLSCDTLVIFVGRLSEQKRIGSLIRAWAMLDPRVWTTSRLALVGDGEDAEVLKELARHAGVDHSVLFPGQQASMAAWYEAADLCVVPSHHEGLSNVMLEAMASGLPVISTQVSGSSVLIEPPAAGVVVDVGNERQLADSITRVLGDDQLRRDMGTNGRRRFEDRFDLTRVTAETIALYERLTHTPSQAARS